MFRFKINLLYYILNSEFVASYVYSGCEHFGELWLTSSVVILYYILHSSAVNNYKMSWQSVTVNK